MPATFNRLQSIDRLFETGHWAWSFGRYLVGG
jgi:hypothetical protein